MTTLAAARLVAAREIRVKLRDKTFLISTAFFLLIAVASTVLPALLDGGPTEVATTDRAAATALHQAGLEVRTVGGDAEAERLVRDGDVDAAVVAGPTVLGLEEPPNDVVEALSTAPPAAAPSCGRGTRCPASPSRWTRTRAGCATSPA